MPAAFALAGLRVARVNHDGPVTGRPFANMALHFSLLPWVVIRSCSCSVQRASFWSPVAPAPRLSRPFPRPFQSFLFETPVGPAPRLSRPFLPFFVDPLAGTTRRAGQRFRY